MLRFLLVDSVRQVNNSGSARTDYITDINTRNRRNSYLKTEMKAEPIDTGKGSTSFSSFVKSYIIFSNSSYIDIYFL